jgi:hypothetical protein
MTPRRFPGGRLSLSSKIVLTALAGLSLGLGITWAGLSRGFSIETLKAGPWRSTPQVPATGGDPYAHAQVSRSGRVPLGSAEGLTFTASIDSAGGRLTPACDYRISGEVPAARFWTLTLTNADGELIESPSARYGLTSSEILRDARGDFVILLSRAARPGNWLPLAADRRFTIVLRLYDSPHTTSAKTIEPGELPTIIAERCA